MKNIHLLPTDKPSRLGYLTKKGKEVFNDLRLFDRLMPNILDSENQHIYITSDEEIKEGDWVLLANNSIVKAVVGKYELDTIIGFNTGIGNVVKRFSKSDRKIILTTDQDLIKDGVQAIDDEFLEWFVNNPSCEEVEVKKGFADGTAYGYNFLDYKIIIPNK